MISIDPKNTATQDLHQYLVGAVAPRPIAFVSTIDENGQPNLAPYSFFNVFSSNPPILVFSSNRRVGDNTTKDTLHNVQATGEVVVNVVNYAIVRQMSIASIQYPSEVSEFEKSGLTPIASDLVKPFRVKESPVQMECKVQQVMPMGKEGGAGHLIICEILRIHLDDNILDDSGKINPHKIDLMGRMGRAFYVRASGEAIHTIFQPVTQLGIGYAALPATARNSRVLTGNHLGQLAAITSPPAAEAIARVRQEDKVADILKSKDPLEGLHQYAQLELSKENVNQAAALVWLAEEL